MTTQVGLIFIGVFLGMLVGVGGAIYNADDDSAPYWVQIAIGKIVGGILGGALVIALLVIRNVWLEMW